MRKVPSAWLRRYPQPQPPRCRLVCLPHAGGSASFFNDWRGQLPADVELVSVQYPGREERLSESWPGSLEWMAGHYYQGPVGPGGQAPDAVQPTAAPQAPGSAEVAARMQQRGSNAWRLIVSAHLRDLRGPSGELHLGADEGLLADVRRLSDGAPSPLDDPALYAAWHCRRC
ncbi:thioesterase domain-containing protein [Pseudomonas protegens]|uniref:thioesterase II family protein n=1 Tax=Pseudomonas protegens TaxID=380021 RepID=UPI002A35F82F|nr:thioesterase domain-containing protein [Pseudomonas protegens]MDX9681378.1 thioesterase domain-containing protein [Pseudomonas protegens]